jgi:hypothetical protein
VGLAVGAVTGGLAGAMSDYWAAGVGLDFVDDAAKFLQPGKVAVVAEVEEEWVIPVDSAMEAVGGTVFRRDRADIEEAQYQRDVTALRSEVASLQAEYQQATGAAQAKLQAKVAAASARLDEVSRRANHRVDELELEAKAKVRSLEAQLGKAQGEMKDRLEARATRVRHGFHERGAKLKQAWGLAKEAFAG